MGAGGAPVAPGPGLGAGPELLVSNWLAIEALPASIAFYDFKGGISIGAAQAAIKACV